MKYSQSEQAFSTDTKAGEKAEHESNGKESKGFRAAIRRVKHDLRAPLEGTEHLGRWGRIKARFVHLVKRYGWKLIVAIILYYLVRDTLFFIIIPYLVARHFID
jgi:hypothetical protein